MNAERSEVVDGAIEHIHDGSPPADIWRRALVVAQRVLPEDAYGRISQVDFEDDARSCANWIALQTEHFPADVSGIWFGLYEYDGEHGETIAGCELSGGPGYPADDEWLFKQNWRAGRLPANGLQRLIPCVAGAEYEIESFVSYALVFAYTAALAVTCSEHLATSGRLSDRGRVGVAAGFHDGDVALVAEIVGQEAVRMRGWA